MTWRRVGRWLLVVVLLPSCSEPESFPEPPRQMLSSAEAIREGERIYSKHCAICHGDRGHGDGPQAANLQPPPSDLGSLQGARAEPGYWFFRIKQGGKEEPLARERSAMPGWGEHLTDEEIWQVVAYLRSLVGEST